MWERFRDLLARPVHGGSLGAFRLAFGAVMALQGLSLMAPGPGGSWIARRLEGPGVVWTVPFPGLEWLRPLPAPGMSGLASLLVAGGVLLALGILPRLAALVVLLSWSWIWLADQTQFNNHWYLMSVLALFLVFLPSARCLSMTSLVLRLRGRKEEPFVPHAAVLVLRGQLLLVYFFGGLTKVTADTLLRAEPVRSFLADARLLGWARQTLEPDAAARLTAWLTDARTAFAFAWSGLLFDLAIGPLLIVRRTRTMALVLTAIFHLLNHAVLFEDIGYFPVLGFAATLIFLDPDWPSRLGRWLRRPRIPAPDWRWLAAGLLLVPVVGAALGFRPRASAEPSPLRRFALGRPAATAIAAWFAIQLALPLRHLLYPGDVNWTGEGLLFGWRMKTSLKTRDLYALLVEDPVAASGDRPFASRPVLYRHVPAPQVDWARLPELLVVDEPPFGERLLYNRMSGGHTRTLEEARLRLDAIGARALGRAAASRETGPLHLTLRAEEERARERGDPAQARLREARVYAMAVARLPSSEDELYLHTHRLRERVESLLDEPARVEWMREALARAHPLALSGAREPVASFLVVEDRASPGPRRLPARVDAAPWSSAIGEPLLVAADFRRLAIADWRRLPAALPLAGREAGGALFWWNVPLDLPDPARRDWVLANPGALQLYARRVAREWEHEHGRRPRVRALCYMSVNRRPPRPIVDPAADLAALPVTWIRHDAWRLPPRAAPGAAGESPDPELPLTY